MVNPDLITLPFHVAHALYNVHGLMRLEPGQLVIECQPIENVIGLVRGPMRTIVIPVAEIAEVSLDKGPFGGRVFCLRTLYLQTLRRFPGAIEGGCQLRIRRANAALAEDFIRSLELMLSEEQLRRVESPASLMLPTAETKAEHLLKVWDGIKGLLK